MLNFKHLQILLLLCLGTVISFAQSSDFSFRHLGVAEGLTNGRVNCMLQDKKGFIWIGTTSGLNRYDGFTCRTYMHNPKDSTSLLDNKVNSMVESPEGQIWIGTDGGFTVYDPVTDSFDPKIEKWLNQLGLPMSYTRFLFWDKQEDVWLFTFENGIYKYSKKNKAGVHITSINNDASTPASNRINNAAMDSQFNFWTINEVGVLEKWDRHKNKVVSRSTVLSDKYRNAVLDYRILVDADDDIWIYTADAPKGAYYFNTKTHDLIEYSKESDSKCRLNTNIVTSIAQDGRGLIWIGTDHGGINVLDKKKQTITYLLNQTEDNKSISDNSISVIVKDKTNCMWIGTHKKGVSFHHDNSMKFKLIKHQTSNPSSVPSDDILCLAEDDKHNIWMGTNDKGLLYYDTQTGTTKQFKHNPQDPNSISADIIVSLLIDSEKKLWIGTYYGGLNCYDGKTFKKFINDPKDPQSICNDKIWAIFEDSQKDIWIGTLGGGIDILDKKTMKFRHLPNSGDNYTISDFISCILEDKAKNIWIGTAYGVNKWERATGKIATYRNDAKKPESLCSNNVTTMNLDKQGNLWIGTRDGLSMYDFKNKGFKNFSSEDGLPINTIQALHDDQNGTMWVSTQNGISNIITTTDKKTGEKTYQFTNYDEADGLQGREFNERSIVETKRGEIFFGGLAGINVLDIKKETLNNEKPPVIFIDFKIFNKSIKPNEAFDGKIIFDKAITENPQVNLRYNQNHFSIEFAAITFILPEKIKFAYKLEGFHKDWIYTDWQHRTAVFTNLNPGKYVFKVKSTNNAGVWNDKAASIVIVVSPPFWKTSMAFTIYFFIILSFLFLARRLMLERERMRFSIEQERKEAERISELDALKTKFFTNVSHEFRTPLTLIITPLGKLIQTTQDRDLKSKLEMMSRNAKRLLNLVNQLLDLRKMEMQEFKFKPQLGDLVLFARDIVHSFSDISEKNLIRYSFKTSFEKLETYFDADKMEKILFNLLSNAFKFTPTNGEVQVEMDKAPSESEDKTDWIVIRVKDSGIGIPKDKQEKIFERFFQVDVPGNMINQGSGIGLSLAWEFTKMHGGRIQIDSEPENGSCFSILLPISKVSSSMEMIEPVEEGILIQMDEMDESKFEKTSKGQKNKTLLIVEDNDDFRFYLKDNLKNQFNIYEAENGKIGLELAQKIIPDLIVSDVMMPEMSGTELCKKIKNNIQTSHIPFILLTARSSEEQKIEGLGLGADDYITKPFNFELLEIKIRNLLTQQDILKAKYHKQIGVNATEIEITSMDEKLIQKAIQEVEKNIENSEYTVEDLSRDLGMSRFHLYKKLNSLTGRTPIEFIRILRLKRAAQLLEKSQMNVSEIAYAVGFNNPRYFSKYFKEEFGVLPSEYSKQ